MTSLTSWLSFSNTLPPLNIPILQQSDQPPPRINLRDSSLVPPSDTPVNSIISKSNKKANKSHLIENNALFSSKSISNDNWCNEGG